MIRRGFAQLEEGLSAVLLTALCVVVALQVFFRLVLNDPISAWSEEVAEILFVWICMVGSSLALKRGEHFAVELFHRRLAPGPARWLQRVVALFLITFALLLLFLGTQYAWDNRGVQTSGLEISRAVQYAAIAFGGLLMLLRSVQRMVDTWRTGTPPEAPQAA